MSQISPEPPVASATMPWNSAVPNPVQDLADARSRLGDTFAVEAPDTSYLFLFSPEGVQAFYDLPEDRASKGLADFRMLARKVPPELFFARRTLPHALFGRDDVARYREVLERAIETELRSLPNRAEVDAFDLSRRIGHRTGLASWGGDWLTDCADYASLTAALDRLDPAEAFVHPERVVGTVTEAHARSQIAIDRAVEIITAAAAGAKTDASVGAFGEILQRWEGDAEPLRGAALDLIVVHLGSMSNLFAATGWLLVDLAQRPELAHQAQTDAELMERCAMESVRLAQRSVMLREVHGTDSVTVDDGTHEWVVAPGGTIATLLPLTNASSTDLQQWDPARWNRRRLADVSALPTREMVTTFGHGSHTCPAQPFSLHAMCRTGHLLFEQFSVTPEFEVAQPLPGQIGGVARSAHPCVLGLARKP